MEHSDVLQPDFLIVIAKKLGFTVTAQKSVENN